MYTVVCKVKDETRKWIRKDENSARAIYQLAICTVELKGTGRVKLVRGLRTIDRFKK